MTMQEIKIGVFSTLLGPYAGMGEDGIRGFKLAVAEFGGKINDLPIRYFIEETNAIPDSAISAAQKLLEYDGVDFTIGPLSGNEGLAMRDFAKTRPDKAFLNGIAGAQDITLRSPAPNFFNFATNGVQWMAGLGNYAYETLGYRRIVTLAEDYSYPHGQIGGFMLEFCAAGGRIVEKVWVPLGKSDFSDIIAAIPDDIDAIFAAVGGSDAVQFFEQYEQQRNPVPLIAGSITLDQPVLSTLHNIPENMLGMISAGPIADENPYPAWNVYKTAYQKRFSRGLPSPSIACYGYYVNTKAALLALQAVGGDLSNGQEQFKAALADLEFETPTGMVRLDHNRQAIADTFITRLERSEDGRLYTSVVQTVPSVNQTLGMPEDEFLNIGAFTRENPTCY